MAGTLLACAVTAGLAACGDSSFDDYCARVTSCQGGNDKDRKACIDVAESMKQEASDYGCSSQFKDLQACQTSTGTCTAKAFTTSCSVQDEAVATCEVAAGGAQGH